MSGLSKTEIEANTTITTSTMEKQDNSEGKTTLVRRVSDLFKAEGNETSSSLLIRHTSMQKLRHCCQNLNLFPILLYSLGHQKSLPTTMSKVNMSLLIARTTERIYRVYSSIIRTILRGLGLVSLKQSVITSNEKTVEILASRTIEDIQRGKNVKIITRECTHKFEKYSIQRRKSYSIFLKLVIYMAPLFLASQFFGLVWLIIFGKYPPGFVFLLLALVFLGCISMKVLNHDITAIETFKRDKRKND